MDDSISENQNHKVRVEIAAGPESSGQRLDQFLGQANVGLVDRLSRSLIQNLIKSGDISIEGKRPKANLRLKGHEAITIFIPPPEAVELIPEEISFDTIYEDSDIIVLSKPPNLVVHPACGHQSGTLVHGLLYHCKDLGGINGTVRPGIIHRLDKDTSGLMVVAKNDRSVGKMVEQFKAKTIQKIYLALVHGTPKSKEGTVSGNIGRHPVHRKKMTVLPYGGRESITHWHLLEELGAFSLLELRLETGRTHQIRVHLASIGLPVAGDEVYGRKKAEDKSFEINRQCLHASRLSFNHPVTGEPLEFCAPLWPDIENSLTILRGQENKK